MKKNMECNIRYSLVLPCYNESATLPLLIDKLSYAFSTRNDIEVILVDNGSTDNSSKLLVDVVEKYSFLNMVHVLVNKGYGYGILQGLRVAKGEFLGWTHADLQTDPTDVLIGFDMFDQSLDPSTTFIKGRRYGRPFSDSIFTVGMSFFDSLLFYLPLWDINAQPTLFSRKFYETWQNPPYDFALDLFAYATAVKQKLKILRFPVIFTSRLYGTSHWNINWKCKFKFVCRTIEYSFILRKMWKSYNANY